MTIQDEAIARLDDVVGRNPSEFPYGFFIRDNYAGGSGNFFWYKTEKGLLKAIKHDLAGIMVDNDDDFSALEAGLIEIVSAASGKPMLCDALLKQLDKYVSGHSIIRMEFLGSFNQLCQDKTKFSKDIRNDYRCNAIEDADDEDADDLSLKELQSTISGDEVDAFAEYISSLEM